MNSVTKIGTLLVVTLSLLCSVEALTCIYCTLFDTEKRCVHQEDSCETKYGEQCVVWTAFRDGKLLHGFQECSETCLNQTLSFENTKIIMKCCEEPLCNKS